MDRSEVVAWLGTLDKWVLVCFAFLAVGAVGELVIHFLYTRATNSLETLTEDQRQTHETEIARLNKETTELETRLAEANLELARLATPRTLTPDQGQKITDALSRLLANF